MHHAQAWVATREYGARVVTRVTRRTSWVSLGGDTANKQSGDAGDELPVGGNVANEAGERAGW